MSGETFTIGTLAKRAGVGVQTVRYYERLGILPKAARSKAGYRRYNDEAVARLRFVRYAAQLGFTLNETKELLALRAHKGAPCGAVRARAEQKLAIIEAKLNELRELRKAVAQLVRKCSGDTAVEHCSILAALSEPETNTEREITMATTDTANTNSAPSCLSCVEACERCIEDCLAKDATANAACIRACRDCIDVCLLSARLEARNSPLAAEAKRLCKLACEACAKECAKAGCSSCVTACQSCATACS